MILLVHENNKALKVLDGHLQELDVLVLPSITDMLFRLAERFPDKIVLWCNKAYLEYVNLPQIPNIFHHKLIMASFSVSGQYFIPKSIGFIDQSVFVNVKREHRYPTWLMSSDVGGVSAEFLNAIDRIDKTGHFEYFINALAKKAMPQGLFCYSNPSLLYTLPPQKGHVAAASNVSLFKFVKQHYKWVWVWVLLYCNMVYKKRLPILAFVCALFYKKREVSFRKIKVQSFKKPITAKTIDVIIPTIGRKPYLYKVLKDLSCQTLLPQQVIVIEQNPLEGSVSELQFLTEETWPFKVKHVFTHQTGACNARNMALDMVESEWVFLFDDDIRFRPDLLKLVFEKIEQYGIRALAVKCLKKNEELPKECNNIHQTGIFGSGNSVVKASSLKQVRFNMALEFGYGEDFDFGVQLRNKGEDVVFFPDIAITHLKAPMGGFRTKFVHPWEKENIQPKPSPTVMYTYLKHRTQEQVGAYKLILFLRQLKKQRVYNYAAFLHRFKKQWNLSVLWAQKLERNTDA